MISNKVILAALGGLISPILLAQNPIVQTCYTTDPGEFQVLAGLSICD